MFKKWLAAFAAIAICGNATPAKATLTTYLSRPSFEAVAGNTTLEDFNALSPILFAFPGSTPFPTGISYFTLSASSNGDFVGIGNGSRPANIDGTKYLEFGKSNPLTGDSTGDGDTGPSVTFNFATPITAFAFDWVDTDPADSYKVIINGIEFADSPFSTSGTGSGFFGVVAAGETFGTITFVQNAIGGSVGPFGIDNVRYTTPVIVPDPVPAPEPSSIAMAVTALPMGLGLAWKRRKAKSA